MLITHTSLQIQGLNAAGERVILASNSPWKWSVLKWLGGTNPTNSYDVSRIECTAIAWWLDRASDVYGMITFGALIYTRVCPICIKGYGNIQCAAMRKHVINSSHGSEKFVHRTGQITRPDIISLLYWERGIIAQYYVMPYSRDRRKPPWLLWNEHVRFNFG